METLRIQSGYLSFDKGSVHCLRMGNGDRLMLAFHGVGNTALLFKSLAETLADTHTILAVDLPGHGETTWSDASFTEDDLMAIVYSIKQHYHAGDLMLLGYSLGGKLALTIAQHKPLWISALYLIAPDGIRKNFWYNFATRNLIGKRLFTWSLNHPERFLKMAAMLRKLRLLSPNYFQTARKVLSRPAAIDVLRRIWPLYSAIPVPGPFFTFNNAHIPLHLIGGKHDRIFPPGFYKNYVKRFKNGHFHLMDTGHLLLHPEWTPSIANIIRYGQNK